jgi:SAM-dependent methyltransferase
VNAVVTTWGLGEYPLMADRLRPAAIAAVDRAEVRSGERVVDVATGTGNAALVAAERGADVVGLDLEPALLALARDRSIGRGLTVRWETADATNLPVADGWADVVLSVFGVMYAIDHDAAARELARCAAPDARIVVASWSPGGFMPAMGSALSAFLPAPPASSGPPSRWGDPSALRELIAPFGLALVGMRDERLTLTFASPAEAVDLLVRTAGHVIAEREKLTVEGRWDDLLAAVHELVATRAAHADDRVRIDLDYLLAEITRRREPRQ